MKPEINKILYATDLSPNSVYALSFALDAAVLHHAEVVILHVLYQPEFGDSLMAYPYVIEKMHEELIDKRIKSVKENVRKRLEKIYKEAITTHQAYDDIPISINVCEGYPAEKILSMAKALSCDMIIMGTHGKGILENAMLGSTAKRVLRRTRKQIFIIPLPKGDLTITCQEEQAA